MAYIGRSGWNTVRLGGSVPDDEILELIDASYETIVAKLPKSDVQGRQLITRRDYSPNRL